MKEILHNISFILIFGWVIAMSVAAFHSAYNAGLEKTPGPFQLIGMLWRGEVNPRS